MQKWSGMSRLSSLAKYPLVSFFALSYAISWAIWTPLVIYYLQNLMQVFPLPLPLLLLALLGAFGPTFVALIMKTIQEGRSGIRRLLSRWLIWRVGMWWYFSIPLITIGIRLGAIGLYGLTAGVNPKINMNLWYMFFFDFLIAVVGDPIAEETGWRGYALPRMQKTRSALISSLTVGMLWTFWHAPLFLIPGMALPAVPFDWLVVLNYLLRVMSLSVLFTWLFNNTRRSIFVAFLFHTAVNSVPQTLFRIFSFGTISADVIFWVTWFTVGLQWLLVVFLIALFGSARLSRKQIDDWLPRDFVECPAAYLK